MLLSISCISLLISLIFWIKAARAQRLAKFIPDQQLLLPVYGIMTGISSAITIGFFIACLFFGV